MKKVLYTVMIVFAMQYTFAGTVFDAVDKPTEVKLAPAITSNSSSAVSKTNSKNIQTIKEEKFNTALVNLDDAQVELRQELAIATAKYNEALNEKARVLQNCKTLKKEIKSINKKMKNVDKSKQMINQNLDDGK